MSQKALHDHLDQVRQRFVIATVLAILLLIIRLMTPSIIVIIAFWACGAYLAILFAIWLWLEWQLLVHH
ncbi:hypothetical protein ACRYI5_04065 [Furfurilactobacillus sp. WILCCON 0119]|uniref:hypothetical protein n=1 Tax=Furfurilactobacillus entadae TaxID=2922307 RepID=UPI0035E6D0FA